MQRGSHNYPLWIRMQIWFFVFICFSAAIYVLLILTGESRIAGWVFIVVALLGMVWFWNLYPEIIADEDELLVRFFFWWLPVKWQDIVDVKLSFASRLHSNWPEIYRKNHLYIVRTRSLTFFHRFYDRHFFSFSPTFYFHSKISGFDELLSIFENKKLIQPSEKLAI